MFRRLHTYTVHAKPNAPDDEPVLVREGFSIFAFLFAGFWLLYHRAWLAGILTLVLMGMLRAMQEQSILHAPTLEALQVLVGLFIGLEGRELQREALTRRGYAFEGIVSAETEDRALLRHYEQQAA